MVAISIIFFISLAVIILFISAKIKSAKIGRYSLIDNPSLDEKVLVLERDLSLIWGHFASSVRIFFFEFVPREIKTVPSKVFAIIRSLHNHVAPKARKYLRKKGSVSFFLKHIADHKDNLNRQEK
ncbi:MAG: hypothetical protein COV70_03585 [Parcubacteria group bacterium CG11_big_fil_rev_8_21_14_0_20_39_22]|nr:MAG: hypothetical protein COV70_03585 [Parcubacteria group bacterium CG11_big_fil_rev_8_21_14_0_20_39_22]